MDESSKFQCAYADNSMKYDYWYHLLLRLIPEKNQLGMINTDGSAFQRIDCNGYSMAGNRLVLLKRNEAYPLSTVFADANQKLGIDGPIMTTDGIDPKALMSCVTQNRPILLSRLTDRLVFYTLRKEMTIDVWKEEVVSLGLSGGAGTKALYGKWSDVFIRNIGKSIALKSIGDVKFRDIDRSIVDSNFVICGTSYDLDVVIFGQVDKPSLIAVCKTKAQVFTVLWSTTEIHTAIVDDLMVYPSKVRDLMTGDVLMDLSNYSLDLTVPIILGITYKPNKSGYFIWLNKSNTASELLWETSERLKKDGLSLGQLKQMPVTLPEKRLIAVGNILDSYMDSLKQQLPSYDSSMPFAVLSYYSLFPYYFRLKTGRNALVLAFQSSLPNTIAVIGYNRGSHRTSKRYSLINLSDALTKIYQRHRPEEFLYANRLSSTDLSIVTSWIKLFLANDAYIAGSRDDKIRLIQNQ